MTAADERFAPRADPRPDDAPWPEMVWPPAATTLRGDHVELTRVDTTRDAAAVFAALDDDRVWQHIPRRPADVAGLAEMWTALSAAGVVVWVVRSTTSGQVLGMTSYLDAVPHDARVEIGFTAYSPSVWGGAVNPEVKLLLLAHAFEELHAGRVQLKTDVRNTRSQQAIARLGASYEGVLRRYQRRVDGTVRDTVMFSLTAEQWPAAKAGLRRRLDELSS